MDGKSIAVPRRLRLAAACLAILVAAGTARGQEERELGVRVQWGGGPAIAWRGSIACVGGRILSVQPLGVEPDSAAVLYARQGAVVVEHGFPRLYEGADLLASIGPGARLELRLHAADAAAASAPVVVELDKIAGGGHERVEIDGRGAYLVVSRKPGDELDVEVEGGSTVYAPNAAVRLRVRPRVAVDAAERGLLLKQRLVRVADQKTMWADRADATVDAASRPTPVIVDFAAPQTVGVYELELELLSPRSRALPARVEARRTVQFVVASSTPVERSDVVELETVFEIHPDQHVSRPRIPNQLRRWASDPFGRGELNRWTGEIGPNPFVELVDESGSDAAPIWRAFPVALGDVGRPHQLEVQVPNNAGGAVNVAIFDVDEQGAPQLCGTAAGLYPTDEDDGSGRRSPMRCIFWPRSKHGWVVVAGDPGMRFGRISGSVFVARRHNFGSNLIPTWPGVGAEERLPARYPGYAPGERLAAMWFAAPRLETAVAAPLQVSPTSGRKWQDWQTYLTAVERVADSARYSGANAVMACVAADGAALYPSRVWGGAPRFDRGRFDPLARDPVAKDVVALLGAVCDREALRLIPTIQLQAAIPRLEEIRRRQDPAQSGIDWIDARGRTIREHGSPTAPRYNPLCDEVQDAVREIVAELATRASARKSFAGIALQITAGDCLQLAGPQWGYDDATFAAFARFAEIEAPEAAGPQRFAARYELLEQGDPELRARWRAWRRDQMTQFFGELAAEVARTPDAKLYLVFNGLLDDLALRRRLRPSPAQPLPLAEAVAELGFDVGELARDSNIVLLRPSQWGRPQGLAEKALLAELEADRDWRSSGAGGSSGLAIREGRADLSLVGGEGELAGKAIPTHLRPAGWSMRRSLAAAAAADDLELVCFGADAASTFDDDGWSELLVTFRKLPRIRYAPTVGDGDPVVVQHGVEKDARWILLANPSPWECTVALEFDGSGAGEATPLGDDASPGEWRTTDDGKRRWSVFLDPYAVAAYSFSGAGEPRVVVNEPTTEVAERLRDRMAQLWQRAGDARTARPLAPLDNYGFEEREVNELEIPGWSTPPIAAGAEPRASLDDRFAAGGARSLLLRCDSQLPASVTSAIFSASDSGRLVLSASVRASAPNQVALRLLVEETSSRAAWQQFIGRGTPYAIGEQWQRFELPINDLPTDRAAQFRVRIDAIGEGDVWVDEVLLEDPAFTRDELASLSHAINDADKHLEDGRLLACLRFFESYWPLYLEANIPAPQIAERKPNEAKEEKTAEQRSWLSRLSWWR